MTANTGMSAEQKQKALQRLESLVKTADQLIARNRRSVEQVTDLLDALQMFKDGAFVTSLAGSQPDSLHVFSHKVEKLTLSKKVLSYLRKRGIRFVGELFYVLFDRGSDSGRAIEAEVFRALQSRLNLASNLDPLNMGWKPEYWKDDSFIDGLNTPVIEVFGLGQTNDFAAGKGSDRHPTEKTAARILSCKGIHYMAQYVAFGGNPQRMKSPRHNRWTTGKLFVAQRELHIAKSPLWAAALIPLDWQPPQEIPTSWEVEELAMLEEVQAWNDQREAEYGGSYRFRMGDVLKTVEAVAVAELPVMSGVSVNAYWGLTQAGIKHLGQLIQFTESELGSLPGIGEIFLGRIITFLVSRDLALGMVPVGNLPDWMKKP